MCLYRSFFFQVKAFIGYEAKAYGRFSSRHGKYYNLENVSLKRSRFFCPTFFINGDKREAKEGKLPEVFAMIPRIAGKLTSIGL